jgi:hydroxymethylbilane synthase
MLPCAGQGALGIEIRSGATGLSERLAALADAPTALATQAERAVVARTRGQLQHAVGRVRDLGGESLLLRASLGHPTATDAALLRAEARDRIATAKDAEALGQRAAGALRQQGATAYLDAAAD